MSPLRLQYRALSFQPPEGWAATSEAHLGHASEEDGRIVLGVDEEERRPSETPERFAARKGRALRADRDDFEIVASHPYVVDRRPALLIHARYTSHRYPLGPIDHVVLLVDRGDPRAWTTVFVQALASVLAQRRSVWDRFVEGIRFEERLAAPRIRPHATTFEPPAGWAEEVAWSFRSAGPDAVTISVALEASVGPFHAFVDEKISRTKAVLESAPALAVDGRAAVRIKTRGGQVIVVDGGGAAAQRVVITMSAAPEHVPAGEAALAGVVESLRFVATEPSPSLRPAFEPGASARGLELTGKAPLAVHAELMRRAFVPVGVPLAAPTTRGGKRRFLRADGGTTDTHADPRVAHELVYLHPDGATVRIFPHGQPSSGLGGVAPGSARISVRYGGSRDLGLDAEEAVLGRLGVHPRTIAPAHLTADTDAEDIALRVQDAWSVLAAGEPVRLPLEDRVGLRLTRTVVPSADFDVFASRVERLATAGKARREAQGDLVRFVFAVESPFAASATLDAGAQVLAIDPIGDAGSVDRLQRFLRQLLRDERYRVFDDATGEDITRTVERVPSFLVAPTRRRPEIFLG